LGGQRRKLPIIWAFKINIKEDYILALFKLLRGQEADLKNYPLHDGYVWVTKDLQNMWFDYYDETNTLVRKRINSEYADKLRYIQDGETVELTPQEISTALSNKVDKVDGKGLSTNDYTDAEKAKLDGIEDGATKTIVDSTLSSTSTNPVQNKVVQAKFDTLQAEIDDKAAADHNHDSVYSKTGHTHSYLPLSGGTIDGRLSVHGYGNNGGLNLDGYEGCLELRAEIGTVSIASVNDTKKAILVLGANESAKEKIMLTAYEDGTLKQYKLYGEHNKPTAADVGAATESFVTDKIAEAQLSSGGDIDLSGYATKDELNAAINTVQSTVDSMNNINYDTYLAFDTTEIV
jgi:hypothetical protein